MCEKCSGTAAGCSTCPPGNIYASGSCQLCPANCFECSSISVCTICRKGFAVTGAGLCRGCSSSCSDCNPYNITECTACAKGLFVNVTSQCQKCPANCLECSSSSVCSLCKDGYTANAAGVCVIECELPCLTCADNQPSYCLTCPLYSNPVSGVCVPDFTCNATNSCTSGCGFGLNYYLDTTTVTCEMCKPMEGCIQCDTVITDKCSMCKNKYYIDESGICKMCSSTCAQCDGPHSCTKCAVGYTMKEGQTEGKCRACETPCASCEGDPKYCTSCVSGFTQQGWHCRNNSYVGFTIVINTTPDTILGDIDNVICKLLAMLQGTDPTAATSDCDKSKVTVNTIHFSSTVLTGSSSSGTSTALSSGLSSGGLGYTVTGSTVTSSTDTESSESNVGLIVGVVVGVIAAVVIVVVVILVVKKKSAIASVSSEAGQMINDDVSPDRK